MSAHYDEQLPSELEPVAARLWSERAKADPQRLDQLKLRLMSTNRSPGGRSIMKSQVATILTIAGLATATGGAVGVASSGDTGTQGGAASGQYVVTTAPAAPPSAVPPSAAPATGGGSPSGVVDPVLIGAGGAAVLAGIGLFGWGRRRRGSAGES